MNKIQKKLVACTILIALASVSSVRSMEIPSPTQKEPGRWTDENIHFVKQQLDDLRGKSNPEDAFSLTLVVSALESGIKASNAKEKYDAFRTALTNLDKFISHNPKWSKSWEREVIDDAIEHYGEQLEAEQTKKLKAALGSAVGISITPRKPFTMTDLPTAIPLIQTWKQEKEHFDPQGLAEMNLAQSAIEAAIKEPNKVKAYNHLQTALSHLDKIRRRPGDPTYVLVMGVMWIVEDSAENIRS